MTRDMKSTTHVFRQIEISTRKIVRSSIYIDTLDDIAGRGCQDPCILRSRICLGRSGSTATRRVEDTDVGHSFTVGTRRNSSLGRRFLVGRLGN